MTKISYMLGGLLGLALAIAILSLIVKLFLMPFADVMYISYTQCYAALWLVHIVGRVWSFKLSPPDEAE